MYKILVVDDEIDISKSVSDFLKRKGHTVDFAVSAEEAFGKIEAEAFDIVLLDITMPGLGGLAALKKIRETRQNCSIIMVTATENAQISSEAMRLGASGYIVKPVALDTLERLIKTTRTMDEAKREVDAQSQEDAQ